jgi:hypothetical protein
MTLLAPAQNRPRRRRKSRRGHRVAVLLASLLAAGAIALISYLLWPTWRSAPASDPGRTPVSIGGTLFNVPTKAFRVKVQRHSGPQERVDLGFLYPSLLPPEAPKHVSANNMPDLDPPIDRIFLSITAHHDALAPELRLRTIYPRYLEPAATALADGLSLRGFRDGSPYANEDLFVGDELQLAARCTRDGVTPGMCLSERRIDGADLTFRFPRQWMAQWRELAAAINALASRLHGANG